MPHINSVSVVVVGVSDQGRSVAFYTQVLGFEVRSDFTYETGERWVEVVAPGAQTSLTLVAADAAGVETGVILSSTDIAADHAELAEHAGPILTPGEVLTWAGAPLAGNPAMFLLRDPDGNSLLVVAAP
jgi:catechol 2,3-dioxygenase-like lactoylglutathione lyase family enzyme